MMDTVGTSYISERYAVRKITNMFSEDMENIYYVKTVGNSAGYKENKMVADYTASLDTIKYCGFFTGGVMSDSSDYSLEGINVIIADSSLIDMGNLKLTEKQKQAVLEDDSEYQKILLGANYKDKYSVGDVFTVSIEKENDVCIAGFLEKGASWPIRGKMFDTYGNGDSYTLDDSGILLTSDYSLYDTSKYTDSAMEFYYCVSGDSQEVEEDIRSFAVENNLTVGIVSIKDLINQQIEESGLGENKSALATVMFFAVSIISMLSASITYIMVNQTQYGIMMACGMRRREVYRLSNLYNLVLLVLPMIFVWVLRQISLFKNIFVGSKYIQSNIMIENVVAAHEYILPVIFVGIVLIMFGLTAVSPVAALRKKNISDLIYEKE
jgi:hypothetical protein